MNVAEFLGNFRVLANAPDGVTHLRRMVLTLAVQGRLVPQSPDDQPASEFLAQIALERDRGFSSRPESSLFSPATSQIPKSWCWARFEDVAEIQSNLVRPGDFPDVPHLAPDNIEKGTGVLLPCRSVREDKVRSANHRFFSGQIVYSKIRPNLSKVVIVDFDGLCSADMYPIKAFILPRYLFRYMLSEHFLVQSVKSDTRVAMPKINQSELNAIEVPVPPLEEQKRIVAKVDELMRLCDRLEAQQQEREKLLPLLSHANHTRFVAEPTDATLHPIFGQIGKVSPDDLRGTVFQLAVMGRLCTRIESEGDTESLLDTIFQTRQQQTGESGVRISSPLPDVDSSTQSPPIPKHWRWVRLGNLTAKIGSGSTPRGGAKVYVSSGVPFLRSQNIWDDGIHLDDVAYITPETHQRMRSTHVSPNDILLNITGASLGRCAKVPSDFATANVSQHVTIIRPVLSETRHFLHICLLSPFGQGMIWDRQVGMAREGLSKKVLEQFEIPLPPLEEQLRIVQRVEYLLDLINRLSEKKSASAHIAQLFAMAAVATITSTDFTENERMKPPKTEVVTAMKVGKKPKKPDAAPLATLLSEQKAEASAKTLWQLSGLEIDAFYRQLKTEMANGWIEEDEDKRAVKEVEAR